MLHVLLKNLLLFYLKKLIKTNKLLSPSEKKVFIQNITVIWCNHLLQTQQNIIAV